MICAWPRVGPPDPQGWWGEVQTSRSHWPRPGQEARGGSRLRTPGKTDARERRGEADRWTGRTTAAPSCLLLLYGQWVWD